MAAKWQNYSIRKKLQIAFVAVIMVPTILLGGFSYYSAVAYMREQMSVELANVADQNVLDISSKMEQCEASLTYAVCNYSLQEFLAAENMSSWDVSNAARAYIGPLLYNILLSGKYMDRMEIFMPRQIAVLNDLIKPSVDVEDQEWYRASLAQNKEFWWRIDNKFYISRKIVDVAGNDIGVMRIRIKEDLFSSSFANYLHVPMRVLLLANDEVIYEKDIQDIGQAKGQIILDRSLSDTGWQVRYQVSNRYYDSLANPRLLVAFLITIFCLIIVAIIIFYLSRSLSSRILVLAHQMLEVREGKLDIVIESADSTDEVGVLQNSFQSMLQQINMLFNQVYKAELQQKDLQLQLLQAKINPHFLYNNLSTINWIAMEQGQTEICEITNALSSFYRTALNRGKEQSTIETELKNAKAYIELQLIAHKHSFEFEVEAPEEFLNEEVPGFVLQPLLENAIEHGIDERREPGGKITVQVLAKADGLYILVIDNGFNLESAMNGRAVQDLNNVGYGLKNVDDRIKLLCGEDYGVKLYTSDTGTVAELKMANSK